MSDVAQVRRFWRVVQEPPSLLKRLEPAYYVFITLGIGGPFVYGSAREGLAEVATPHAVAVWGPSLLLVALLAAARWGAVQGPVVFSSADVAHLLGAPLRRADLALGRLVRGLVAGAGAGAVLGGLAVVGVAGHGRGVRPARAAAFVAACGALGVLGVALASLVQGDAATERASRIARWPILAAAAALVAVADAGPVGRDVALWSGPWGWAVQPLATAGAGAWPAAAAATAVVAAATAAFALARRGATPTERHLLRAEARDGAVAALYSMNARWVRRSLTTVAAEPATPAAGRLPIPSSPRLAVAWRDAAAALNAPARTAEALALATGGAVACLLTAGRPVGVAAGALLVYASASRLLEPLRTETDQPSRARVLLRAPMGRVLQWHAAVPAAVALTGALLAVGGCAAAGALPAHGAAVALALLAGVPAITLCAALSSRRGGQLPPSVMAVTYGDATGMSALLLVAWIVAFPALAAALAAVPQTLIADRGANELPTLLVLLAGAGAVLAASLGVERYAP